MAISAETKRRFSLHGVLMLVAGLYAIIFPDAALTALVIVGGVLLVFFAVGLLGWAWRLHQRSKPA